MYFNMMSNLKNNLKDEKGQGMVEYILIIALIGIALIVAFTGVKDQIVIKFDEVKAALAPATP
jgi:Flp pilus assembly pilin Flp